MRGILIAHYEKRAEVFDGKAMIVTMSRRIAVALYEEIIALRPQWHSEDLKDRDTESRHDFFLFR